MVEKANLTEERIQKFAPPEKGEAFLWDSKVPGFGVRCFPSGRKVYVLMYRVAGGGRKATRKRVTIGPVDRVPLSKARSIAQGYNGEIAGGGDPLARMKTGELNDAARLDNALVAYDRYLERRKVENRDQYLSKLRRGLPAPHNKVNLADIDRRTMMRCIEKMETPQRVAVPTRADRYGKTEITRRVGGPGAAAAFRTISSTFFNWAVDQGLIASNPIAGWRRPRATRAERLERSGRTLTDSELRDVWSACDNAAKPYGDYVRMLLLTGQRRNETAAMRWADVDLKQGLWMIPASVAKNGRAHPVPLPPLAMSIISRQERNFGSDFVFTSRGDVPISGWSKRQNRLIEESGANFKLHDLRKTFRSGLTRLGVAQDLAEMMLNHTRAELLEIYDREPRLDARREAADAWARHVETIIRGSGGDNVVLLKKARA